MSSQMSDKSQTKIASFLFNKPFAELNDDQKQTVNRTYQKSTSIVKSLLSNAPTNSSTDAIVSQALSADTITSIEKSGSRISGELKSKIIENVVRFFPQNRFTSTRFNLSGSPYTASSYAEKYANENEIELGQQPSVGRPPAIPTITEEGDGASLTMPTALSGQARQVIPSNPRAGMGAGETPAIQQSTTENTVDETDVRLMEGGGSTEDDDAGAEGRGVAYADYTAEETKGEEGMVLGLEDEGVMKSSQQPSHTRIIDESQRPEMPQQIPTQPTSQEEIDEIAREQVVETLQGIAGEGAGDVQDTGEMVSEQEAVPDPEDTMGAGGQPMGSSVPSGLVVSGAGDGGDEFDGVPDRPSRQSPADLITQSGLLGKPKYYQQLIAQGGQLAGGATPFKGIKADDLSPLSNKEVFELIRITVKLYGKRIGVRRQFTTRTSKRADLEQEYHELSMLVHMYYSVKMGMSSAPRMGMILPQSMMGGMAPLVQQLSQLVQSRSADAGQGQQQGQGQHSIHAQHAELRNSMLQNRAGATGRPTAQLQNTAQLPTQLSQFASSVRQSSSGLSGSGMQFTPFYGTRDRVMSSARQVEGRGEPIRIPFR